MKRINTEIENVEITQVSPKLFSVRSLKQFYQVWLGSDDQLPTCQCIDYTKNKLPCKHICAVVQQPGVGWESLGSRFDNQPLFSLDEEVTLPPVPPTAVKSSKCDVIPSATINPTPQDDSESVQEIHLPAKREPVTVIIPSRKRTNAESERYNTKRQIIVTKKAKKQIKTKKYISVIEEKEEKLLHEKSVGTVADSVNAKVQIDETGKLATKRKGCNANTSRVNGKKKRGEPENERNSNRNDVWVEIGAIKLTYALREILGTPFAWLTDDHIHAAQHIIRELGIGVGGLNCIATMTHCTRFAVPHENDQAIQCHNIRHHWVTSSSITGKVVVYESMATTLNDSLKRQLVCLYKQLCNDDGSHNITVVLQQKQRGSSDCDLFCIANAVAVANGVDPNTLSWHQGSMREHLCECFEQKKIEMFPHDLKQAPNAALQSHYVVSIYCICLNHIPGAQMVYCTVCENWFHHGHPKSGLENLTAKQAAALATDAPFVCEYCEIDKQKKKDTPHTSVVII